MYLCVQQQCSYSGIQATATTLKTLIGNFSDPAFVPKNFDTQVEGIVTQAGPCFQLMATFADFKDVEVPRVTDDCVLDQTENTAAWKADPCCNPALQLSQCCVAKTVNETEPRVTAFKAALTTACGNPNSAKPLVNEFFSDFKKRIDRCDSLFKLASTNVNSQEKKMIGCFSLFSSPPKCKSDAECYGGVCSPKTKKCVFAGPDDPNPVLNCMFDQVPPVTVRNIRQKFGFKGTTPIADVRNSFKSATTALECQDAVGQSLTQFATKTACEASKKCNLPLVGGQCPTKAACALCDPRGICDFVIPELTTNATCTASGQCLGGGPQPNLSTNQTWDKATCENGTFKYCTVYDKCNEDNKCDATKCAAVGECVGFPFEKSTCVFPYAYDNKTDSISCPVGREFYDEGCADSSSAVNTTQTCTAAGGQWFKLPTTKAECEAIQGCFDGESKTFNTLPSAECTKCKNTYKSRYTWNAGQWVNSIFVQDQKWIVPAQVPVNRWITAINQARLQTIIGSFLSFQIAPAQQTYLQCAFNPIVDLFTSIACDCGTSKGPNGTCYPAAADVAVGTQRVFSGLTAGIKQPSVSVTLPNNTVDATKDVDAVVVSRTTNKDLHATTDIANYYDMFNIHFLNQANAVTGVSVSSGYSVKRASGTAFGSPVTLCITRDKKVTVGSTYTVAAFATKDGTGALVKTAVKLVGTDYSNQMCGEVQTTNTYYAAFFTQDVASSPGTNPTKSPTTGSAATVFLTCLAIFFSVLGYMF